jgi:nitrogen fixation-related uncharacterized protein
VTGRTQFYADRNFPGLLHLKMVRSPHHHARIKSIDVSKALKVPGVVRILTAADIPSNIYTILQPTGYIAAAPWPFNVAAPPEPVAPSILVTPPAFPALNLDPPEHEEVIVAPDSLQNSIGLAAGAFAVLCPFLTLFGAVAGAAGIGNILVNILIVGVSLLMAATLFGVWWAVLEKRRRDEEEDRSRILPDPAVRGRCVSARHVR